MYKDLSMFEEYTTRKAKEEFIQDGIAFLQKITEDLGFEKITSLASELRGKLDYTRDCHYDKTTGPFVYKAIAEDGCEIFVSIKVYSGPNGPEFSVDIINSENHKKNCGNHDFNKSELDGNLRNALIADKRKKHK